MTSDTWVTVYLRFMDSGSVCVCEIHNSCTYFLLSFHLFIPVSAFIGFHSLYLIKVCFPSLCWFPERRARSQPPNQTAKYAVCPSGFMSALGNAPHRGSTEDKWMWGRLLRLHLLSVITYTTSRGHRTLRPFSEHGRSQNQTSKPSKQLA